MKKSDLSSACLAAMREAWRADGRELFPREFFLDACPGVDGSDLSRALHHLAAAGAVSLFHSDDEPSTAIYLPGHDADLSAIHQPMEQPADKERQHCHEQVPREQPQRRKRVAVSRFVLGVVGTVIATVAAYWIMRRLGWV